MWPKGEVLPGVLVRAVNSPDPAPPGRGDSPPFRRASSTWLRPDWCSRPLLPRQPRPRHPRTESLLNCPGRLLRLSAQSHRSLWDQEVCTPAAWGSRLSLAWSPHGEPQHPPLAQRGRPQPPGASPWGSSHTQLDGDTEWASSACPHGP